MTAVDAVECKHAITDGFGIRGLGALFIGCGLKTTTEECASN
jgi:hypothetical protein